MVPHMSDDSDIGATPEFEDGIALARTIRAPDGRVLVFSCDQFVEDICQGDCCFICGARPGTKPFNGEHVIPRWLLKRFALFKRDLVLFDGQVRTYGSYKMPCCAECNSLLGARVETPVSKLLAGGFDDIVARLNDDAGDLLFVWMCLLFLKTHLKDRTVPLNPDPRAGDGVLADAYDWPDMHHLHCVVRSPYVEAEIGPGVRGSLLIFKIADDAVSDTFDYGDLTKQQTVVVRIGDFGMVAVLNDARAAEMVRGELLSRIDGPISTAQLREIAALLATANADLVTRPTFGSAISANDTAVRLWASQDQTLEFAPYNAEKFGEALAAALRDRFGYLAVDAERDPKEVEALVRSGRVSFLFDNAGAFRPSQVLWEPRTRNPRVERDDS